MHGTSCCCSPQLWQMSPAVDLQVFAPWLKPWHLKHLRGRGMYRRTSHFVQPMPTSAGSWQVSNVTTYVGMGTNTPFFFCFIWYSSVALYFFSSWRIRSSENFGWLKYLMVPFV